MDASEEPPDDLRVRLKWPGMPDTSTDDIGRHDDFGPIRRAPEPGAEEPAHDDGPPVEEPRPEPVERDYPTVESSEVSDAEVDYPTADAEPGSVRQAVTTQQLILAGRSDSLQAALASIALRIDALTSTTSTFRNLVSDRLTDYAEQVGRLAAGAASDLDDYRHLHERSLEQIRRSVGDAEDNLRKLSRMVGDLELKTVGLVAAVRENGDAVDHLLSERDHVSDTLLRSLDRVGLQVQTGLEQGLEETAASMARLEDAVAELAAGGSGQSVDRLDAMIAALTKERERQLAVSAQLQDSLVALADDRARSGDNIGRLEQAIGAVTTTHDRGLSKLASRIDARMDQIAGALEGLAGEDLAAILTRLDARLKELSTEVVSGRDRETARGLTQLSAQLDGVAGMIAESRAERQPLEARLSRVSPAAPDLSELYARLDEMAETLSQYQPPDLQDLHVHLDELGQALARRSIGVDPKLTGIVERLERLMPALQNAPVPRARLGDPAPADDRRELLERIEQVGQRLGDQIEALRRRIALRARPAAQELDSEAIAAIADAVIARLGATEPPELGPPSRPALSRGGPVSGEQRRRGPR